MGYTSNIMQATIGNLTQMQTDLGNLASGFQDDANNMARVTGDLVAHNFQGPKAISLVSMTQNYQSLLHSHAYDRLQQLSQICKAYQQAIENACTTFDSQYPQGNNDFAEYVFNSGYLNSVPNDLPHADQDVNNAISANSSGYLQQSETQLQSQHVKLNRTIIMGLQDEISSTGDALYTWAEALNTAFNQWQNGLTSADVHNRDIPTLKYDDGTGKLVSVPINTTYEQSLTTSFNKADPGYRSDNADGIEALNPELFQQMVQVYPDPRTQEALTFLASTPTGMQFFNYYLYMGKKLGPNFISWGHLGKTAGAVSTYGGFVVLNLDDPNDQIEMAGYLVHEGVESYFDGQGIRQMGTEHADYVAEWFQGKFMQEAGGGDSRSYQQTFHDWINGSGSGYVNIDQHKVGVTIYTDGSTLVNPGQYWPDGGDPVTVTGIPNPGLDPRMLLSDNLNQTPYPQIPPPPPPPPFRFGR